MKKIIFLTLMLCSMASVSAYDFEVDGIFYNITSESSLTVEVTYKSIVMVGVNYNSYHGCLYSGSITIPESVAYNGKEYTVTGIGAWAFGSENNVDLTSYWYRLTSIVLPKTIEYIDDGAFCHCDALSSLIIPSSVKDIYGYSTLWCKNCELFIFLSPSPPMLHGSNPSGNYALYIPGEIVVPQISLYIADPNWNHEKDEPRWGGLVEMLTANNNEFGYDGQVPAVEWTNNLRAYTMNVYDVYLEKDAGNHSANVKADFFQGGDLAFSVEFPFEYRINKAKLTAKVNNANREYGEENPQFNITYSGFVNGEDENVISTLPTASTIATKTSNVGEYPIIISGGVATNYVFEYESGILTITPRTLLAYVGNYERPYNEENPAFVVTYEGFVCDDNESVLIVKPTASTIATKTSDVGTYPIEVSGGSADNYTFSYVSGTLTINKAEQTISWNQDLSNLNVGDQVELKAVASSGLPITYTMDNNNAAEIYWTGNKSYLDCIAEGAFQIMAVQEGNQNYYSTQRIRKNVVIGNSGTGIDAISSEDGECQYYSLDGRPLEKPVMGVNIIRMSDGTVKKVVIK